MKRYILAVSGGPDSMAMLNIYARKTQAVCVVDYNKRMNSAYDVSLVVEFCKLHNIKYYVHKVDKKFYQEQPKTNFQSLARDIRYKFFTETCDLEKNHNLMIAHNLNDHVETAYMQFNRKSKALFYGIKRKGTHLGLNIFRPLLSLQKTTILRYCNQQKIKYAIDYTNELDIYERNRVRKIINEWTSEQFANFIKKINKYNQQHARQARLVKKYFAKWTKTNFSYSKLLAYPEFYQYYLIYKFLKLNREKNNNQQKIEAIIGFLKSGKPNIQYRLENNRFLSVFEDLLIIK